MSEILIKAPWTKHETNSEAFAEVYDANNALIAKVAVGDYYSAGRYDPRPAGLAALELILSAPALAAEVARLRTALEFYANPANHEPKEFVSPAVRPEESDFPSDEERWDSSEYHEDGGDRARRALEAK